MNVMTKPTMILLLLNLLFIVTSEACPSSCECEDRKNGDVEVDCRNQELTAVPDDIPSKATLLYLENNSITSLSPKDFGKLVNLTEIRLEHNIISKIEDNTFLNNSNLLTLSLNKNKLNELTAATFKGAIQLGTLQLEDNPDLSVQQGTFQQLESLQHLHLSHTSLSDSYDFENMDNLVELKMNNNHVTDVSFLSLLTMLESVEISANNISEIPLGTFNTTQRLNKIYMDSNNITTLEPGLFSTLKNLSDISLKNNKIQSFTRDIFNVDTNFSSPDFHFSVGGNPINCDCNMKWLASTTIEGQCSEPYFVDGVDFSNMNLTDYQCGPRSNYGKGFYTVSEGGHITMDCPILIDPVESIFWETPVKNISSPPLEQSEEIYILETGDLKVQNAKMEHRGFYHCVLGNKMGNLSEGPIFLDVDKETSDSGVTILALSISLAAITIFCLFLLFILFKKRLRGSAASRYRFLLENSGEGGAAEI